MVAEAAPPRSCPAAAPRIVRRGGRRARLRPGARRSRRRAGRPPVPRPQARRLALSTAIFSFATAISRVLGLVREIVAKNYFGVEGKVNAFQIAFLVPNTVRALVADAALSSAFVPGLQRPAREGRAQARVARRVEPPLADAARPRRADGALHPGRAAPDAAGSTRRTRRSSSASRGCSSRSSRCSAPPGSSSGSSTATTSSRSRRSRRSPGTSRSSSASSSACRRRDTTDGKLYVYAGSIVVGTVIQVLLPVPWLRGRGGRLRDGDRLARPGGPPGAEADAPGRARPRPDQHQRADRRRHRREPHRSRTSARPRSTRRSASTCSRRASSRSRSRRCSSRRSRASPRAATWPASAAPCSLGVRQIVFLLVPASIVVAVLAEPLTRLIYQRGAFTPDQTPVVAASLAALRARADVQRDDADAEPRVLQPPVELDPDARRAREPVREPRARPRLRAARRLGDPARDVAREHRRHRDAARPAAPARRPDPLRRDRRVVVADRDRRAASPAPRRSASGTALDDALGRGLLGQLVSLGVGLDRGRRPCTSARAACCASASWTRCARSARASAGAESRAGTRWRIHTFGSQ